ncbi:MAG: glycosyl hydrolase family 18 [Bacteroides sp.]|nr:glycosyl hydrolase family 18 [Bacteroides sp.]
MKTKSLFTIFAVSALALAACKPDGPTTPPEPVTPEYIPGTLVAEDNRTSVTLREGTDETRTLAFTYQTDKELSEARTVTVAVDAASTLPKANYELSGTFAVAEGADESDLQTITFKASGLQAGEYTLVLTETVEDGKIASEPLEFNVTVRTVSEVDYELDTETFCVLYVNTDVYSPLLASAYYMYKTDAHDFSAPAIWARYCGNIVNLRGANLKDNDGYAELVLGEYMKKSLAERAKYIYPLQDQGRKVCLALECGTTGLGFCNLSDEQIDDFVAQVKNIVFDNELDGVNFWDRNTGYDKDGAPEFTKTSYPKLIKRMKEVLGAGKLVTLTDVGRPTESFHDVSASGDIKVGEYLDYAWSGYGSIEGDCLVHDPYGDSFGVDASEVHKPIAGLAEEKYGCIYLADYGKNSGENLELMNMIEYVATVDNPKFFVVSETRSAMHTGVPDGGEGWPGMGLPVVYVVLHAPKDKIINIEWDYDYSFQWGADASPLSQYYYEMWVPLM